MSPIPDYYMPGIPASPFEQPDPETVERVRESLGSDSGQTLHSSMLLPCPFCGEERPSIQTLAWSAADIEARVVCPRCHASTSREDTPQRYTLRTGEDVTRLVAIGMAISSWNRRALMADNVSHPAHYGGSIECKDALASRLDGTDLAPMAVYWLGCAFKYLWRFDRKGGVEDLRKARQCIDFLIEEVEG